MKISSMFYELKRKKLYIKKRIALIPIVNAMDIIISTEHHILIIKVFYFILFYLVVYLIAFVFIFIFYHFIVHTISVQLHGDISRRCKKSFNFYSVLLHLWY